MLPKKRTQNSRPHVSALWRAALPPFAKQLGRELNGSLSSGCMVVFRADDIGVPSKTYQRLVALFATYQQPLCLALVPAWVTPQRWQALQRLTPPGRWCWHQHGWRHANHVVSGKKAEFGEGRSPAAMARDLRLGWQRLKGIVGEALVPVFTPPWNRLQTGAGPILEKSGFQALSSFGTGIDRTGGLPDVAMTIDLHTRKGRPATEDFRRLIGELKCGLSKGYCGIMIHHQRMNSQAFDFLELLLAWIRERPQIGCQDFRDLLTSCAESELMKKRE